MRLIDADELTKAVEHRFCDGCNKRNDVQCKSCGVGDVLDMLDDAPTVDAVKVTRCRDCENCYGSTLHMIDLCDKNVRTVHPDEEYCSYGTPKEANT